MKQWKACLLFLLGMGILSGCGQHGTKRFAVSEAAAQYREEKLFLRKKQTGFLSAEQSFPMSCIGKNTEGLWITANWKTAIHISFIKRKRKKKQKQDAMSM